MADPIGITLGAIALADTLYVRCNKLWKAYKVSQAFGGDFQHSLVRLEVNEQLFKTYLTSFNQYLQTKGKTNEWKTQHDLRMTIRRSIEAMVEKFSFCYVIVEKYEKDSIAAAKPKDDNYGSGTVAPLIARMSKSALTLETAPSNIDSKMAVDPHAKTGRRGRLGRLSGNEKLRHSCQKYFSRSPAASKSSATQISGNSSGEPSTVSTGLTSQSESSATGKSITDPLLISKLRHVRHSSTDQVIVVTREEQEVGDGAIEESYDAKKAWSEVVQHRQNLVTLNERISWVRNGKIEFQSLIHELYEMNQELRDIVPKLKLPWSFGKIRGERYPPRLWEETAETRKALESLNVTLRRVNRIDPVDSTRKLKITVRLEEDHDDTRLLLEENAGFYSKLQLRHNPFAFRLATYFEQINAPLETLGIEVMVCTTISKHAGSEIVNLKEELEKIEKVSDDIDEQFVEVGCLMPEVQNGWSLYRELQLSESEWRSEQTLEDFVGNSSFGNQQRIELAAKIAISYLHCASVNKGFSYRPLSSYRYFRDSDKPHDWAIPFIGMPWLDFGFGSQIRKTARVSLNSHAPLDSVKIDHALELGLLLYQITSCQIIPYETSSLGLKRASEKAKNSLNNILEISGVPIKEIVETCFEGCPEGGFYVGEYGEQDPDFVVIEEVAAALRYHVELLRKSRVVRT